MKKITLLLFFFSIIYQVSSQVTVGSGNLQTESAPFEPYYGYSYTQSVYLSSEINATGTITDIQWYYSGSSALANSQELVIYMAESSRATFASNTDWEPITSFTEVYAGGITVTPGVAGWVQLTLSTPFVYNGTGNLIIAVEENQPDYDSFDDDFFNSLVSTNRTIYYYSDTNNPNPAAPPTAFGTVPRIPNIILGGISQACPNPTNITGVVTVTTVDLSWDAGAQSDWEFVNQIAGTPAPTDSDSGTPINTSFVEIMNLIEGTNYQFYVRTDCGGGLFSGWAGPFSYRISGPGETCSNPIQVIVPLPYITTDNTNNYGDDYSGSPGANCSSTFGYLNGDDVVYQYSPTADTSIDIELSNLSDTYAGIFVYTDCADIGVNCVAGATNFFSTADLLIDNFSVTAGTNYYIVISTWASPQSVGYTLTISENTCIDPVATYAIVSNCTSGTGFFVDVDLTDLGSATSITMTDNQGSTPQSTTAAGVFTFGPFANETDVIVTVTNDEDANCVLTSSVLTQEFCQDFIVDCSVGPQTLNYCYSDGGAFNPVIFTYTSNDGTPLRLTFNSGVIEQGWDELAVIDTDGSFIVDPADFFYGNNGDLSGLTYQSTGDTISFYINSDGIFSCQTSGYEPIDVTVSCATCINPVATYAVVDDCDNGEQFLIDVNLTSIGDATSLTISNNIDANTVSVIAEGIYQVGPFPFLQNVIITISNDQDVNCIINSPAIQLLACPPANDNCDGAIVATVNADGTCAIVTPGTVLAATPSGVPNGSCTGNPNDDVWFQFTALHENETISLLNISGGTNDLDHAVYSGSCGSLTQIYCSPNTASAATGLTIGQTYYIRVFSAGLADATSTFNLCITESPGNVLVDQTTYTVEQLVQDILINSPCAVVSNISFSTGTNYNEDNGIGYFYGNGVGFPFEDGIIMTSGNALQASGPNVNAMSAGTFNWPGDADLNAAVGITSNNATIIEFDFIPLADEISFEFLMASEEYNGSQGGTFECTFSDAFAFLLTDQNGNTTNLAVLPGTTTPILVTNIHPENPGCPAINEEYFGGYTPQNLPPISFDGRTEVFTAYSQVNIGQIYHIKLVIADASDTALDSGVYLKAGSFDLGEIDLGQDITIEAGTAVCEGGEIILETNIPNVAHTWYQDGIELGETSSTLSVTEPGEYTVQIIFSAQCFLEDVIVIEFFPNPEINLTSIDLFGCSDIGITTFNLQDNNSPILGTLSPSDYSVSYYLTEQEATDGTTVGLSSPYTNLSNPQIIWARVTNNVTSCFETTSFNLIVNTLPDANPSPAVTGCDIDDDGISDYDLTVNEAIILGGQTDMTVTYHTSQSEADAGTPDIANPVYYSTTLTTIYVRVENNATGCYNTTSFGLTDGESPVTTFTTDFAYEVCPNATVPVTITATPINYTAVDVTISWYRDGALIPNQNGLTLPVLNAGLYEIEVRFNETGCIGVAEQQVIELASCVIPQGISPNNDGLNDSFDLSSYQVSRLEIFNRNGTLVYSKTNYIDEWFGQTNSGDELPVGTYFYSMIYQGGKEKTGWVYINR